MALLAITFGLLLSVLGAGFYYATDMTSVTALIPTFFGLALILLGLLALGPKNRMHAMHGAALVGLVGLGVPTYRMISKWEAMSPMVRTEHILMAVLCGLFLILCVKSFIDARRRRRQQGSS